jgi:outer membrane protein, heavy metal efflux system
MSTLVTAAFFVVLAPGTLRLPELLAEVGDGAPAVAVAKADVAVRRAGVRAAGTWDDATFSVMSEAIPLGRMSDDAEPTMISYRIGQSLNVFGRRGLRKQSAQADVARGEASLRRAQWDARGQAVELFYELWMVDAMQHIVDEQIALLDRMREAGLARVRAGMGSMGHHDVLRAESEIAAMAAERASLDDERVAIVVMLNTLRGRRVDEAIGGVELPAATALPEVDVAAAARGAPEVAAARAMKDGAAAEVALARRMYWPMVMVEAAYEHNLGGMPDGLAVGVSVTVPLWWWDRQRGEVAMARAMARRAEREEDAMTQMASAELQMAWSRARAAERKVAALEDAAIPKLRETILSIEAAYIAGTGDFLALLDAVMQLQELEARRVAAVVRRGVSRFELDRISGREVAR